ncbi:MAG: helix-turn-helix domain-containing protein [Terriglobales bacterium]|jgi:DNA-binding transcriptional ArsR family regulator
MASSSKRRNRPQKSIKLRERQLNLIAKALADPHRYQILQQAGSGSQGVLCADIREHQTITAPTLSHHIKELENAGLLRLAREGKFMRLILQREILDAYLDHLRSI